MPASTLSEAEELGVTKEQFEAYAKNDPDETYEETAGSYVLLVVVCSVLGAFLLSAAFGLFSMARLVWTWLDWEPLVG